MTTTKAHASAKNTTGCQGCNDSLGGRPGLHPCEPSCKHFDRPSYHEYLRDSLARFLSNYYHDGAVLAVVLKHERLTIVLSERADAYACARAVASWRNRDMKWREQPQHEAPSVSIGHFALLIGA